MPSLLLHFFFNETATTELYTLSVHDALPISSRADFGDRGQHQAASRAFDGSACRHRFHRYVERSEEHTSELQSRRDLVCRLLLEKKNEYTYQRYFSNVLKHHKTATAD